jgi:hypothetical protein
MSDKPKSSEELIPQADQQASSQTAQHVGKEGEQAKVLQEQAKQPDQSKVIDQAKESKDQ